MDSWPERLATAWAEARAGHGQVMHLVGPFGAGKSGILDGLEERVGGPSARGAVVRAGFGAREQLAGGDRGLLEALVVRIAEGVRAIGGAEDEPGVPWLLPGADFLHAVRQVAALPGDAAGVAPCQVHADLLLHVARNHPVLLALDDVHHAGPRDRALLTALAEGLAREPAVRLLVVAVSACPLGAEAPEWSPAGVAVTPVGPWPVAALAERARHRLAGLAAPDAALIDQLAAQAHGSPRVLDQLARVALEVPDATAHGRRADVQGLRALARGERPAMAASVAADLRDAAVAGPTVETELMAQIWGVPAPAAEERLAAVAATGFVYRMGARWRFVSSTLAAAEAQALDAEGRARLHRRVARALLAQVGDDGQAPAADLTETWSDNQQRDRRVRERLDKLWQAAWHFAEAGDHAASAEAATRRVEQLFEQVTASLAQAARYGARVDRERRHAIQHDLAEAEAQLSLALGASAEGVDPTPLAIEVRLLTARARFRDLSGSFSEALRLISMAVAMARHLPLDAQRVRLEALRVQVEISYASGDHNAGRESLAALLRALDGAAPADAIRVYAWLGEAVGRYEWVGLHDRIYPAVLDALQRLSAHKEGIKARVDRLAAALEADGTERADALLAEAIEEAGIRGEQPYLAELLAHYAADLVTLQVDAHFDSLSGEFFPPDLFGEAEGPPLPPLRDRMARPVDLLTRAEVLAEGAEAPLTHLRVLTVMLSLIYDVRERFGELLQRWWPAHGADRPIRLVELDELLARGFFDIEQLEALTDRVLMLAQTLGLDQVLADTLYEALDRELPGLEAQRAHHLAQAAEAYGRLGDHYGLITLALVAARPTADTPTAPAAIADIEAAVAAHGDALTPEQLAFAHLRLGELLMEQSGPIEAPLRHFEHALRLYDQVGDVQNMQTVAEFLRDVYRRQGDLGRYRMLRERFRTLEDRTPGVDPLGLELRIDHLLNLARQEADDERAIEMVERCVQLFARVPDGTTRVDECFVEISKLCRRRADQATTEAGYNDWLQRSLEAVRTAGAINREVGNYHRLFEESHELFDDLLGLGAWDDYLLAREESRGLAFGLGNVNELFYLFDEHLQYDPSAGFDHARLPEVRGFYEALSRYLQGLGATGRAAKLQATFAEFLDGVGEEGLAAYYREQPPIL